MIWIFISNFAFCQDTSQTKLIDKYYPESKKETPPPPINKEITPVIQTPATQTSSSQIAVPKTPVSQVPLPTASVSQTPVSKVSDSQAPAVPQTLASQPALSKNPAPQVSVSQMPVSQNHIYRDTRLGSSSPAYQTYKENDNGAGSVTNNPNKGAGSSPYVSGEVIDSSTVNPIRMETRLGSSSPLYNTYQKNDNGAGAITTNPNKQ